jgi:hypothetical protein
MVDIIIKIPNDKIDEFKLGFKKVYPSLAGETDLKMIKRFIREQLLDYYITGKTLIAQESTPPEIDEEIVE